MTHLPLMKMRNIGCIYKEYTEKGILKIKLFCLSTHRIRVHSELDARTTVYILFFPLCKHMESTCQEPLAEKRTHPARILCGGRFQFGAGVDQWQQKNRCDASTL